MPFPEVPDDIFDGFDWSAFDQEVVKQQIEFVSTLDDEQINKLSLAVDGFVASNERARNIAQVAHGYLKMGLRLLPVFA